MNILLYTAHSPDFVPLAIITEPPKRLYAYRHGYDFRSDLTIKSMMPQGHFGYGKIVDLLRLLNLQEKEDFSRKTYDWIYWSGSDVLITNPEITLESIIDSAPAETDLIIANDAVMWSADSFLIRNTNRSAYFLRAVLEAQGRPQIYSLAEQEEMWNLRGTLNVHEVAQKVLTPYLYEFRAGHGYNEAQRKSNIEGRDLRGNDGRWSPGDFVCHLSGLEDFSLRCYLAAGIAGGKTPRFVPTTTLSVTFDSPTDNVIDMK